jgi:hypothetical protein
MRATLLIAAISLMGCAQPRHIYKIEPIKVGSGGGVAGGLFGKLGGAGAAAKEACAEKCTDTGNWFVRRVWHPDQGKTLLYSVEILYCPTDKMNFSQCRTAVAWSRGSGKGGVGVQEGAPPSPVQEGMVPAGEPATSGGGGEATSSGGSAKAGGGTGGESTNDIVEVKQRTYFDLSASELATLRGWIGKQVSVSLSYGKTVTGQLAVVDGSGVNIDRNGKNVHYRWDEIGAVFSGR